MNLVSKSWDVSLKYLKRRNDVDVVCFTANNVVKNNGCLVMGAGTALAVVEHLNIGSIVKASDFIKEHPDYGAVFVGEHCLAFQTKRYYGKPSTLAIIKNSVERLAEIATKQPNRRFHLPFPAVGLGSLTVKTVLPSLVGLPHNVYVYHDDVKRSIPREIRIITKSSVDWVQIAGLDHRITQVPIFNNVAD
jgi:hypothetical protein